MAAIIIDGKAVAKEIEARIAGKVLEYKRKPGLGVLLAGDNPASQIYVRRKEEACKRAGIMSVKKILPSSAAEEQAISIIKEFNDDPAIDAILVQLPLPAHIDEKKVLGIVREDKDADGFELSNLGRLVAGIKSSVPCTPKGVMRLLEHYKINIEGKHAVVIGRSTIVGKPMSLMLLEKNATVTICHSKTQNLKEHTQKADILVVAAGKPELVTKDMVKHGAVVIDVGMNRDGERLVGDVDFEQVSQIAAYITPVPGGVGPMTIAMLLENTMELYKKHEHQL